MLELAGCKINLGLSVTGKRPDGYHEVQTVLYPVSFFDMVDIVAASEFSFRSSGLSVPGSADDNLVVKAWQLMHQKHHIPPGAIHLHKKIFMGAGLGGGSSDAVAALKILNKIFDTGLNKSELKSYAALLGSDCPFFVDNRPALATGTGTTLTPTDIDLSGNYLLLVKPGIHIATAAAYAGLRKFSKGLPLNEILSRPVNEWQNFLTNDFEAVVFESHPAVARLKKLMYESGALYASMTGSGSAVYGIFDRQPVLPAGYDNAVIVELGPPDPTDFK